MRAHFIAAAALSLAVSTAAFAEDRLTVFISDPGYNTGRTTVFDSGTSMPVTQKVSEWNGGVGVAFSHSWDAHWSTEGSIAVDQHHIYGTRFVDSIPVTERRAVNTYPVDLMMRFQFPNDSRWTPYLAAGGRYVGAPHMQHASFFGIPDSNVVIPVTLVGYQNRLSAQVGVGTTFRITPRVGLQFDLKRLVRNDSVPFDPLTRASFGVNWKF